MGLFDTVELPAEIMLPRLDRDPSTVDWQTKSIGWPCMRTFRVTSDGRLLQEEAHCEPVPEEDRPHYGTDKWDDPLYRTAGSVRTVHEGWSERAFHGIVRLAASVDGALLEYEAKFTDGRLVAVRRGSGDGAGEWVPAGLKQGGD